MTSDWSCMKLQPPGCTKRSRTSSSGWCPALRSIICGLASSTGSRAASRTSGPRRRSTSSAASRLASTCPLGMFSKYLGIWCKYTRVKAFSYFALRIFAKLFVLHLIQTNKLGWIKQIVALHTWPKIKAKTVVDGLRVYGEQGREELGIRGV